LRPQFARNDAGCDMTIFPSPSIPHGLGADPFARPCYGVDGDKRPRAIHAVQVAPLACAGFARCCAETSNRRSRDPWDVKTLPPGRSNRPRAN
jgi:hypothetical protein